MIWVQHLGPTPTFHIVECQACMVQPTLVVPRHVAELIANPRELPHVVGQHAETFFAFTQRLLSVFALYEVRCLSGQHVQKSQLTLVWFMRLAPVG